MSKNDDSSDSDFEEDLDRDENQDEYISQIISKMDDKIMYEELRKEIRMKKKLHKLKMKLNKLGTLSYIIYRHAKSTFIEEITEASGRFEESNAFTSIKPRNGKFLVTLIETAWIKHQARARAKILRQQ